MIGKNTFETFSTPDKAMRDRMFREFRESTEINERQAVKYSGVSEAFHSDGVPLLTEKGRHIYQSVYFVAYPTLK